ncbi:MAG: DUF177 domain-containing protein [Mariprofundales bacterium]
MVNYTFRIGRKRGAHARQWQGTVSAALLSDSGYGTVKPSLPLCQDACWQGSLETVRGGWQLRGTFDACVKRECSNCCGVFAWPLHLDVVRDFPHMRLTEGDEEVDDGRLAEQDDRDCIDLIDLLREEMWLSWEQFVRCASDCRGLCSGCGCNLNRMACGCSEPNGDHPFAALAKLKL